MTEDRSEDIEKLDDEKDLERLTLAEYIEYFPKAIAASTVYASSYIPFFAGCSTCVADLIPNTGIALVDYGANVISALLGAYLSYKLQRPAIWAFTKIIYSGSWKHLRFTQEQLENMFKGLQI